MVKIAAENTRSRKGVTELLLLEQRVDGFKTTQGFVAEMAQLFNVGSMALLLEHGRDRVKIVEEVAEAAGRN